MRKLIALLTIFSLNAYAVPPVSVDSEQSAVGNYVQNTKLPNEQATQLTTRNTRIETGNTNLLKNPSFEHLTLGFGWTISNATYALNTTNQVEGKKAITLTPTAAMTFGQDSAINAANLTGLQGVASVKIKATGTTGLKVCPRNAGAAVTNLCVNVTADNTWKHISIPFILGATSNGIGIATTATGGTVIIDDAFVGTSAPFQDVSGARLMGTVVVTGCASSWATSSTTITDFSALAGCSYSVTGLASSPSTNIPGFKFSSLPAGDYRIEYEGQVGNSNATGAALYYRFWDGSGYAKETSSFGFTGAQANGISQSISYSTTQSNITLSIRAYVTSASANAVVGGTNTNPGTFKLWYFPPASKIYSQASQDYDWTAYTPTFTGFGTVSTSNCSHKRKGSDLYLRCNFVSGTSTATEARLSLPNSVTTIAGLPSLSMIGQADINVIGAAGQNVGSSNSILIEPSTGYVTFAARSSGLTGITKATGSNIISSGNTMTLFAGPIPISGWSDYGVIVGSFAGLEKCANDYECTDTFSAVISDTGVVSNENIDWLNGNCTVASSVVTCTYNTNLKDGTSALSSPMNCTFATVNNSTALTTFNAAPTSTGFVAKMTNSSNGAAIANPFHVKCQKGSQDYKAKSAKVASSIGVPTVPGITTQAIDTFSVSYGATVNTVCSALSSNCAYNSAIGTGAYVYHGSIAGNYILYAPKTYLKLNCTMSGSNSSAPVLSYDIMNCTNCSNFIFKTAVSTSGATADSYGVLSCQGTY